MSAVPRSADVCRVYATTCENAAAPRGQRRATGDGASGRAATRPRATGRVVRRSKVAHHCLQSWVRPSEPGQVAVGGAIHY